MILDRTHLSLLTEAAKSPTDLPDGVYIEVKLWRDTLSVEYRSKKRGKQAIQGSVVAELDGWPCSGAFVVATSGATRGWGPLLYDVAMEYASIKGGGLAPDREDITEDSYAIWNYYLKRRPDVKKVQLDNRENYLTKKPGDNCAQGSAEEWGDDKDHPWHDKENPLSKAYIKKPAKVTAQLKKLGKIKDKGL
tara:strand:+ start:426 stop:1001 length:576 start_codon:yes stop_codon:yes gene_type:complete